MDYEGRGGGECGVVRRRGKRGIEWTRWGKYEIHGGTEDEDEVQVCDYSRRS